MKPAPRPCPCGCSAVFARPKSFPLCKAATTRVYAFIHAQAPDDLNERGRISNRVWIDEQTVAAIVTGDLTEAVRRIEHRAAYGLYADPDRALTAAS